MKIKFDLTDEKTVTNTTVKVNTTVRGTINGETREQIEARCLTAVKKVFPDNQWAFSNFNWNADGLTFSVAASTRIDAIKNSGLNDLAKAASDQNTKVGIQSIDASIPQHDIRRAESALRENIIMIAQKEAEYLSGKVVKVDFSEAPMNSMRSSATMKAASYLEDAGVGSASLGHSEKVTMTATITVEGNPQYVMK